MYTIKQSTALTIPFFAHDVNGDGVTGMVDAGFTKRISKGSGAFGAYTVTITEMENGWYSFPLSTTDSNTLGLLTISFSNASAKRINLQFRVEARLADDLAFPATSGRSMVVDAAGLVDANAVKVGPTGAGTAQTAGDIMADTNDIQARLPAALVSGRIDASVGAMAANVVTAAAVANGAIDAATFAAGAIDAAALAADAATEIRSLASGTADSGSTTTMVDAARTEADTDYWKGSLILFTSGTLLGQTRLITAFDPATDTVSFAPATTVAVATHTYEILPAGRADVQLWLGAVVDALSSGKVPADLKLWLTVAPLALVAQRIAAEAQVVGDKSGYTLASLTGQPRTDLLGENADFEAGTGARKARLDAAISSRAAPGAAMDLVTDAVDALALATDAVNEVRDAVFARAFSAAYNSHTFDELVKMMAAILYAKCSGMATATGTFRNLADTADVIVATIDADGNRSAVTRTP